MVCALYIPEVRFGNVTTMEPIMLQLIPQERFNKVGKILLGINSVDTHYILCKFNCDETVIGDNVHTNFSMVHRRKKIAI